MDTRRMIAYSVDGATIGAMPEITQLPELIAALPGDLRAPAEAILRVESLSGRLALTDQMRPWVERHFGAPDQVERQRIIAVTNRLTLEGALFNPLRAMRPGGARASDAELDAWVADELAGDIFADPLADTPADPFGRIAGRYCVTASNIAKYAGWHGLVIPREPHPLRFSAEQIDDYLETALRWVAAAQVADPSARYPLITWNCLPKSGATIVHAHWQIAIAHGQPYARVEAWRRAAAQYQGAAGRGYLDDLSALHEALGCGLTVAGARAWAHLTPQRPREVVLLAHAPPHAGSPAARALAGAISHVLRALVDTLGTRAFNMAIALPPPGAPGAGELPTIVRIGDRGPALTTRGDMGAMELYGTGVIAEDPLWVAAQIRAASR
jgi:hypothetical protein